jgi:hypothetical protein
LSGVTCVFRAPSADASRCHSRFPEQLLAALQAANWRNALTTCWAKPLDAELLKIAASEALVTVEGARHGRAGGASGEGIAGSRHSQDHYYSSGWPTAIEHGDPAHLPGLQGAWMPPTLRP